MCSVDIVLNSFKDRIQYLLQNFLKCIEKINNNKISQDIFINLFVKYNNKKKKIGDIANITIIKFNILKIEVFQKEYITFIKKAILKYDNTISITVKCSCLFLEFKDLCFDNNEKKKKIFNLELNKFKLDCRMLRRKILNDNKNKLCKDDFIKLKKEIEKLFDNIIVVAEHS